MRVLAAHNFYRSVWPSGENRAFEAEQALLRNHNHQVHNYTRHSDEIRSAGVVGLLRGAVATPWNPLSVRAIRKQVVEFSPHVVHVHNTFPLISPSIFHAVGRSAARVLTLHNYRLLCPAAIPSRKGRPCTECIDRRSAVPSIVHGCYRNSRVATAPVALNVALHRRLGTWAKQVDAFIVLSQFQKELMVKGGLPCEKVHVKPNFYPGRPAVVPWSERRDCVVFVGRLAQEKGLNSLMRAWQAWGPGAPELRIVGDGELRPELERMAAGLPIRFLDQIPLEEAQDEIGRARLQILPSECFEGFPMVLGEAFAFGTPTAVSRIGPLPSIVHQDVSGIVFEPGNPDSMLAEVKDAWETPGFLQQLGVGARAEFEGRYTEEANHDMLMTIYEAAIETSRRA